MATSADGAKRGRGRPRKNPPLPKTRYQMLIDGDITIEDLDDEELRRGVCRNRSGNFSGRPPKTLPAKLVKAMQVEFRRRVEREFQEIAVDARNALHQILMDKRAQPQARVNAAALILERSVGKVPDKVEQDITVKSFEDEIEGLLVDIPEDELSKARKKKANG